MDASAVVARLPAEAIGDVMPPGKFVANSLNRLRSFNHLDRANHSPLELTLNLVDIVIVQAIGQFTL